MTYDRAYSRWLPVPRAWVSPDGSRYAYPGTDGVYIQNVANGTNVELGGGRVWNILDVETEGVYVTVPNNAGLWLLPFSGAPTQITPVGYWQAMTTGAAYGTETSAVPQGVANTILKLDIGSATATRWFTRPGAQSWVTGFDAKGDPIIIVRAPTATETWITTGPDAGTPITISYYQGYPNGFSPSGPIVPDSHGLWFSGNGGIALYVPGTSTWYWMGSIGAQVAGSCA